ncbi:U4/U6-U5 snRNP complex subunit lsm6 [Actinomortierella ambigua]|nr:U4/U6-U5 snRNP complex subunit lsm6 [Actinomortierella ambigua]
MESQNTQDFTGFLIGRPVIVKLNSGVDYRGILACLDGYMNIALEQTEELVNGQVKNQYGDTFIRGNNGNQTQQQKERRDAFYHRLHASHSHDSRQNH